MNIFQYFKDKLRTVLIWLCCIAVIIAVLFFSGTKLLFIAIAGIIYFLFGVTAFLIDFSKKSKFYREFLSKVNSLEKPYEITKNIDAPAFFEGEALLDTLAFCLSAQEKDKCIADREYVFLREHIDRISRKYRPILMENRVGTATKNLECSVSTDGILFDLMIEQLISLPLGYPAEKSYIKIYAVQNDYGVLLYAETNASVDDVNSAPELVLCKKICKALEVGCKITKTDNVLVEVEFLRAKNK